MSFGTRLGLTLNQGLCVVGDCVDVDENSPKHAKTATAEETKKQFIINNFHCQKCVWGAYRSALRAEKSVDIWFGTRCPVFGGRRHLAGINEMGRFLKRKENRCKILL